MGVLFHSAVCTMKHFAKFGMLLALGIQFCLPAICCAEDYMFDVDGYPPFFIFKSESTGRELEAVSGIIPDLLAMFEGRFPRYHVLYRDYPRKRANMIMETGRDGIDLMLQSPLFVNEAVRMHYDMTDMIFHTRDVVVTARSGPLEYRTPEDLYGKRIGTICGYGYGVFDKLFEQGKIENHCVQTHSQNLQKLKIGRIDAYFGNIHVSPYFMKLLHLDPGSFRFSDTVLLEFDLAFVVRKKHPRLVQDFNTFLHEMKEKGTLTDIVNRYIR